MIDVVSEHNLEEVLPLIRQYQEFYQVADISDANNRLFFSKFGEGSQLGCQFLYRDSGQVVSFATVYFTYASTLTEKVGVLNDLYTLSDCRGKGIARKLIERCREYAAHHGAARLQWVTAPDNKIAQALYDSMDTNKSTWHFYTIGFESTQYPHHN